jgi:hypothetical protein
VKRAPLPFAQKLHAYFLLLPWTQKHFRRITKDLLIAADQIIFNYQNRDAAQRGEKRSAGQHPTSDMELTTEAQGGKTV